MFDNIGTSLVQAVGFTGVFGYFVYQLLSEGKKTNTDKLMSTRKKVNDSQVLNNKTKRQGLFGKKTVPIKEEVKPKKKGWFN